MKYLLKITIGLFIGLGVMASCDDDDEAISGFALDKEDITIGAEGGTDKLMVTSGSEWVATASEPWVMISPANGFGSTECEIVIDSTLCNGMRTASIRFTPDGQPSQTIKVNQTGFDKMISIEKPEVSIEASAAHNKRFFEATVTTNVEFNVNIEFEEGESGKQVKWMQTPVYNVELDRGARPRTVKIRFNWNMNPDAEKRIAKVHFIPVKEEDELKNPALLTVTQDAAPEITDTRAGDSLALIIMNDRLACLSTWDASENMLNWSGVTLWEVTDKELPGQEAIGRVRSVAFRLFGIKETIPQEVHYLTYLEKLELYGNTNTNILDIDLASDICDLKYLKDLTIGAYGLISLPDDFVKLGKTLEVLDLSSNNFDAIPEILTKDNFPHLKSLRLSGMRRWDAISDLGNINDPKYANGIGLHLDLDKDNTVKKLLLWDTLEELSLSYGYLEGSFPDFTVGEDGVEEYTQLDVDAFGGDTIQWLVDKKIPKILPNAKQFSINLNFLTGNLPDWVKYHPHLLDWNPEAMIFNQMEKGVDSDGNKVGFSNEPANFEYYYTAFPKFREKYEFDEE